MGHFDCYRYILGFLQEQQIDLGEERLRDIEGYSKKIDLFAEISGARMLNPELLHKVDDITKEIVVYVGVRIYYEHPVEIEGESLNKYMDVLKDSVFIDFIRPKDNFLNIAFFFSI